MTGGQARVRIDGATVIDLWTSREPGTAFFGLGSKEVRASVALAAGKTVEIEIDYAQDRPHLPGGLRLGWAPPEPDDAM